VRTGAKHAAIAPASSWVSCRCGRPLYEHGMRTVPSTGGRELVCTLTPSGRFEPRDPGLDYHPEYGLVRK
jgi:hypothetical protein